MDIFIEYIERIKELYNLLPEKEKQEIRNFINSIDQPADPVSELQKGWEKRRKDAQMRGFISNDPTWTPPPEMIETWRNREKEAIKLGIIVEEENSETPSEKKTEWNRRKNNFGRRNLYT